LVSGIFGEVFDSLPCIVEKLSKKPENLWVVEARIYDISENFHLISLLRKLEIAFGEVEDGDMSS